MALTQILTAQIEKAAEALFGIALDKVELQATRKDFEGDITMVIFPLLKLVKGNPADLGGKIGAWLQEHSDIVERYNVVAGFLNIVIADSYYLNFFQEIKNDTSFGFSQPEEGGKAIMVEYASPNTNKPLHLGHVRNVLLGYSVAEILKASGKKVYKTQIVNDRGIHICKSMLAWKMFGNGETPETAGVKGDKLVGKYYVLFEEELRKQATPIFENYCNNVLQPLTIMGSTIAAFNSEIQVFKDKIRLELAKIDTAFLLSINSEIRSEVQEYISNDRFISKYLKNKRKNLIDEAILQDIEIIEKQFKSVLTIEDKIAEILDKIMDIARDRTDLMGEAQEMLRKWEAGDEEVVALWKMMNGWVYSGFDQTFANIGVDFDKNYYESDTYLLGKDVVEHGLEIGVFYRKEDGSVWINLTPDGLDEKLVLRRDGTSVYMTQDIGTAIQRVKDFPDVGGMVYTVGNEQDYHFKVLFLILKKLGYSWAESLYHLSYGMVDLPSGKMKSREGTVVDADDLMGEMTATAKTISEELGKLEGYSDEDKARLYRIIGLGALKYYILKVDPKKRILFNPEESVDFGGNTGPFIQYTYARVQSLLRKAGSAASAGVSVTHLHEKEKELLKLLSQFPDVIQAAATGHSPALVANYTYDLVKEYNSFYQSVPVLGAENEDEKAFRVQLSKKVGDTIKSAFGLLGIEVPERM